MPRVDHPTHFDDGAMPEDLEDLSSNVAAGIQQNNQLFGLMTTRITSHERYLALPFPPDPSIVIPGAPPAFFAADLNVENLAIIRVLDGFHLRVETAVTHNTVGLRLDTTVVPRLWTREPMPGPAPLVVPAVLVVPTPGAGSAGDSDYSSGNSSSFGRSGGGGYGGYGGGGGGYGGPSGGGDSSCYKCGQLGHILRDCIEDGGSGQRGSRGGADGGGDRSCYNCGQPGHISRDCSEGFGSAGGRHTTG